MTKRQFKYTDILIFAILAILCQLAGNVLVKKLDTMFYMSFASIIAIIAMLRWGPVGSIVFIATGVYTFATTKDMTVFDNVIYNIVAQLFIIVPSLFLIKKNRDSVIKSEGNLIFYALLCYLSLGIGKGLAIFIINGKLDGFTSYIGSQSFVIIISIIVAVVLSKKTEIICDMDEYLIRINKEKEEGRVNK